MIYAYFFFLFSEDIQAVGCKTLRSKRYISDGFCTSIKPITEVVCAGHCLPVNELPWYAEFMKTWSRSKVLEYRCVEDVVKRRKVRLICDNDQTTTYRIKVVKSCKCKRYMNSENQSYTVMNKDDRKNRRENRRRKNNESDRRKKRRRALKKYRDEENKDHRNMEPMNF